LYCIVFKVLGQRGLADKKMFGNTFIT